MAAQYGVGLGYAGIALEFATEWLQKGVEAFELSFADLATFGQRSFDVASQFSVCKRRSIDPKSLRAAGRSFMGSLTIC
jgi:hypothetical protein